MNEDLHSYIDCVCIIFFLTLFVGWLLGVPTPLSWDQYDEVIQEMTLKRNKYMEGFVTENSLCDDTSLFECVAKAILFPYEVTIMNCFLFWMKVAAVLLFSPVVFVSIFAWVIYIIENPGPTILFISNKPVQSFLIIWFHAILLYLAHAASSFVIEYRLT